LGIFSEVQKIQILYADQVQSVLSHSIENFLGENKYIKEICKVKKIILKKKKNINKKLILFVYKV
jgi:hypothetical protein